MRGGLQAKAEIAVLGEVAANLDEWRYPMGLSTATSAFKTAFSNDALTSFRSVVSKPLVVQGLVVGFDSLDIQAATAGDVFRHRQLMIFSMV